MMNWRPTKGKVLGEIIKGDYESPGGILIVSTKKKKDKKMRVIRIGKPFENEKGKAQTYRAEPGEVVYFKMRADRYVTVEGKTCLVLDNEDILVSDAVVPCVCEQYLPGYCVPVKDDLKSCAICGKTVPWMRDV